MKIPHCCLDVRMPHQFLNCQDIASAFHQEATHAMTGKDMNTPMLFDSRESLVVHEHAIDAATFPESTKIRIEQRFATIYLQRLTCFHIASEGLSTIISVWGGEFIQQLAHRPSHADSILQHKWLTINILSKFIDIWGGINILLDYFGWGEGRMSDHLANGLIVTWEIIYYYLQLRAKRWL